MNSDTREFPPSPGRLGVSRKLTLTNQPSNRSLCRKTSRANLPAPPTPASHRHLPPERGRPGPRKSTVPEARSKEAVDPQRLRMMLKLKTSIRALDRDAELYLDRNPLMVIHSQCRREFVQNTANDIISNFKQHVSVCKSPRLGIIAASGPTQLPCLGFGFKELCGKDYRSLPQHQRQQVTKAIEAADLAWLDSREKRSIVSKSCSGKSPSLEEPVQPCENCSKVIESSKIKAVIWSITPRREFFSAFFSIEATRTGAREDKKTLNVSSSHRQPRPTLTNGPPIGGNLVPTA